jgi:hypothetical protein
MWGFATGAEDRRHDESVREKGPNLIIAECVSLPEEQSLRTPWDALRIDRSLRNSIKEARGYLVVQSIARSLAQDTGDIRHHLEGGQRVAKRLGWETVAKDYFLPALRRC